MITKDRCISILNTWINMIELTATDGVLKLTVNCKLKFSPSSILCCFYLYRVYSDVSVTFNCRRFLMPALMPNIRKLRDDLRDSEWHMTGFPFTYKQSSYSVLCENLDNLSKKNTLAIVLLTFIDDNCHSRQLVVEANSATLYTDPKTLREYFRISYGKNMGDIIAQFYSHFAPYIPERVPLTTPERIRGEMISKLCARDGDDPNARFCFSVYRNGTDPRSGEQRHRRIFNQDRAKLLVPDLYEYFKNDTTISFCFSADHSKEQSTHTIIQNYASRYGR